MTLESIVNGLKLVSGRQLSKKQMDATQPPNEEEDAYCLCSFEPMHVDRLRKLPSGQFVRTLINYRWDTTPDASYGYSQVHSGYYPSKSVTSTYDKNGKLIEREVTLGNIYAGGSSVTREYNPHGRFIGKRRKE